MRVFSFDPERFSKTEIIIGGIRVFVYNTENLHGYLKNFDSKEPSTLEIPINMLYLLHGRSNDSTHTESFGYKIAERYYANKAKVDIPLVFVTFDARNHGPRMVSEKKNLTWKEGNNTHGEDILSIIDGTVLDLKLIMDYLPIYLNLELNVPNLKQFNFKFNNIISGYSMGGHTTFRFASRFPELVSIINPVVGSSDLSSLLIDRLLQTPASGIKRFLQEYDEIGFGFNNKVLYPKVFHEYLKVTDDAIFEQFPFSSIKMFASFDAKPDSLVPYSYSKTFCEMYKVNNPDTEIYVQDGVDHDVTIEMLNNFTDWLLKHM